jgi:Fe2+ transport system protein B
LPCLSTLSALKRELDTRSMLAISALTVAVALAVSMLARGVYLLFAIL